jgi:hypothetical protein
MNIGVLTSKRNQARNHSRQREGGLTTEASEMVRENVEQLVSRLQARYGYTREKAELEAGRLLDRYDHRVYEMVRKLPGDIVPKVIRYPWATIATVLGLGLLVGFIVRPTNRCE